MSKGKFAIGAIIGAVAGIVAGVLTAPKSGKETRADLKAKAGELKEDALRQVSDAKNSAEEVIDETKGKLDDARLHAAKAVSAFRSDDEEVK